jgi:HTH-type transcriptional regulator/antitoxin HigA
MDIRPIRTDRDHRAALKEIDACWGAPEGSEKGDRLECDARACRELRGKATADRERLRPVDVLRYALDELGHTRTELAELLGSRSRASESLSRRRALTVEMIYRISETWKIPADLLVRPYRVESAA